MATPDIPTADELLELVVTMLGEIAPNVPTQDLKVESSFTELEIESVTIVEVIAMIEEKLDLSLPDDELTGLDTIRQLAECVRRQRADV